MVNNIEDEVIEKEKIISRLMDKDELDSAITLLEETFATEVYSEFIYRSLFQCYYQKYGQEKAIETLKRIVSKCEKNKFKRLRHWRSELKHQEKMFNQKQAELKYSKDMEIAKNTVGIGDKFLENNNFDEAIKHYESALEMGFYDYDYCYFLGQYYHFKNDFEKERDIYRLIVKNIKNSPYKNTLPYFRSELRNVESFLNNGEWLLDCIPFDYFNHFDIVEKLYKAKKLIRTGEREKGINLLEELMANGTYINEVYYELYLAYNKDKRYDDSIRVCEKAIEVLGFFSYERWLAWIRHRQRVVKKIGNKKISKFVIDINDLKGIDLTNEYYDSSNQSNILRYLTRIDLTNKYYDPSKPFVIENEFYTFCTEPEGSRGGINYEFISEWHYSKGTSSDISAFNILFREMNNMFINFFKIVLLKYLFENYENINFNNLFLDLTKIDEDFYDLNVFDEENYNKIILYYQKILHDYNLRYDEELLDNLFHDLHDWEVDYLAIFGHIDVETIMSGRREQPSDFLFEIAYIRYLQLVDSENTSQMDKLHYFDTEEIPDDSIDYYFEQIDFPCSMELIKEVAIKRKHVEEGFGIKVLNSRATIKDIKGVINKYNLKKSGNKPELINRIKNNLTAEEINNEFKDSRFILTEQGREFLNKQRDFNIDYYDVLPSCFSAIEFYELCRDNPEYSIEDIIYSLVMHEWYDIKNRTLFNKDYLNDFILDINRGKFVLAKLLDESKQEKINELYFNIKQLL